MEPRLTTEFWVRAYLRRLDLAGITAFVAARGDETAGAVLVVVAQLDGTARLYQRSYDLLRDTRAWVVLAEGSESQVADAVARQRRMDPDLWVIEIEDRAGRSLLGEDGLSA